MRYADIKRLDIADGTGIRVGLYTQGCPIRCPGCHNKEQQDFDGGEEYTEETEERLLRLCEPDYINGLSVLGGEPFIERNLEDLAALTKEFRERFPSKTIWIWTGYAYEALKQRADTDESLSFILNNTDVLVDGPFVMRLRDITSRNPWRGSRNQRVLDVRKTLESGTATPLEGVENAIWDEAGE